MDLCTELDYQSTLIDFLGKIFVCTCSSVTLTTGNHHIAAGNPGNCHIATGLPV